MESEKKSDLALEENGFDYPGYDRPKVVDEDVEEQGGQAPSVHDSRNPNRAFAIFISVLLVVTGSCNTLAAKWADRITIRNGTTYYVLNVTEDGFIEYGVNDYHDKFGHPFFQATVMFVGEMTCGVAYFIALYFQRYQWKKKHPGMSRNDARVMGEGEKDNVSTASRVTAYPAPPKMNYFLFAAPAFCDVCATSVQYLGLNLTSASSYQMLRGAVIIFTGLMALFFLKTKLQAYRWVGMVVVVLGLAVVGVADILLTDEDEDNKTKDIIIGDILIIVAQIVVSVQMVVEQKLLSDADVPALLAVGLEGIFGFLILSILMIPMYWIHVPDSFSSIPGHKLEDALNGFWMMKENGELIASLFTTIVSIAFFNFAGITVTKFMSATTRMVLDSVRTIIIWAISIPLFDSQFIPEQIPGFILLVIGMFLYNDILIMPFIRTTHCWQRVFPPPPPASSEDEAPSSSGDEPM